MFSTAAHECPACGHRWTANAKEERQITAEWRQRQMNKAEGLIAQGVSGAEAARRLNVPGPVLYQWLSRDDRHAHRLKADLTRRDQEILAKRNAGLTYAEIASQHSMSPGAVGSVLWRLRGQGS